MNGTRQALGANFGSVDWLTTVGNANYNALQLSVRHSSRKTRIASGLYVQQVAR